MEREREVVNLLSIFNLTICKALGLPESVSARVMLLYDKRENAREFRVLSNGLSKDVSSKIKLWLEDNIDINDVNCSINENEIDADHMSEFITS